MKIIHLSDLHFGTETPALTAKLLEKIETLKPDLFIISGDFTQIATEEEFKEAAEFINKLPADSLCIPGNHDVPAFNLVQRFLKPYDLYRKYIDKNLCPTFENDQVLIAGLNSARRALPHWNWANGAISSAQRQKLTETFVPDEKRWTLFTLHHPVHKVDELPISVTVFGRKRTLQTIKDCNVDIVLTGHVHHASVTTIGDLDHQTVFVSASTALSSRKRTQENGFNVIALSNTELAIDTYALNGGGDFEIANTFKRFKSL